MKATIGPKLEALFNDCYTNALSFELAVQEVLALGIVRLEFDWITHEARFYTPKTLVHSMMVQQLIADQKKRQWSLGAMLDSSRIEKSLLDFDAKVIDSTQFHFELSAAGVVSCSMFLEQSKIYYMGCDGQYYLEKY